MKVKECFEKVFLGIFSLFYAWIFLQVLFFDKVHNNDTGMMIIWMAEGAVLLVVLYFLLRKYREKLEKLYRYILPFFLVLYGIILIHNGISLRFTPAFDMDAVYGGAIQWLQESSFKNYYEYYGYFPNNLGAMGILYLLFKLSSVFGITDFFLVGIVVNSLFIVAAIGVISWICKKLAGVAAGVFSLAAVLLCLPFFFMGAAFYTDSLSLLFPVLFYALYIRFKEITDKRKKILQTVFMGIVLGIGIGIKFTVIIIWIAVLMDALLSVSWKQAILLAAVSIFLASGIYMGYRTYIYNNHITEEQYQELQTPYWHWVMMGLKNSGSYNPEDYEYTRSFSLEERAKACRTEAFRRIKELKLSGLYRLWSEKTVICFGDGTYALSDFLDDSPQETTAIHDYVLYGGKKYKDYEQASTGLLLLFYLLAAIGALLECIGKKEKTRAAAPRLAMVGIFCFLLLWETSGRYFTNYIPLLIISMVLAFPWKERLNK